MAHEHMMLLSMSMRCAQQWGRVCIRSHLRFASPPRLRAAACDRVGPAAGRQRGAQLALRDATEPRARLRACRSAASRCRWCSSALFRLRCRCARGWRRAAEADADAFAATEPRERLRHRCVHSGSVPSSLLRHIKWLGRFDIMILQRPYDIPYLIEHWLINVLMPAGVVDAGARLPPHQIRRAAHLLTRDCRTTFLEARQRGHPVRGGAGHCLARPPRHLALLICTRCFSYVNWE